MALSSRSTMPQTVNAGRAIGIDMVQISRIEESRAQFGDRFVRRLFAPDEVRDALQVPAWAGQRLAARFAAKEAVIKAFGLCDAGIDWRDIEVVRAPSGVCSLRLHGRVAQLIAAAGEFDIALSLSHGGDYAMAVVVASTV